MPLYNVFFFKQKTAYDMRISDWSSDVCSSDLEREADMPAFAQTTVARLQADLDSLRQQGFKLAVIDTPPAITMAIQSVISVAELIVIPTRPSPHDLRAAGARSEEHTSELQSLMRISYAVFCLKKKKTTKT